MRKLLLITLVDGYEGKEFSRSRAGACRENDAKAARTRGCVFGGEQSSSDLRALLGLDILETQIVHLLLLLLL